METLGKFSSNGIHARSLNEVGKDLLPIDETFSCVLVENVKMNAEGQLIGEKSRMPMANAKVQHSNRPSISTFLVIPSLVTPFSPNIATSRGGQRVTGWG